MISLMSGTFYFETDHIKDLVNILSLRATQQQTSPFVEPRRHCDLRTMHCLPGCYFPFPSGSSQPEMRSCPSGPPASWGIVLPTGSQGASSEWHYWGQPYYWGWRETHFASVCGAERDCRRKTHRFIMLLLITQQCLTVWQACINCRQNCGYNTCGCLRPSHSSSASSSVTSELGVIWRVRGSHETYTLTVCGDCLLQNPFHKIQKQHVTHVTIKYRAVWNNLYSNAPVVDQNTLLIDVLCSGVGIWWTGRSLVTKFEFWACWSQTWGFPAAMKFPIGQCWTATTYQTSPWWARHLQPMQCVHKGSKAGRPHWSARISSARLSLPPLKDMHALMLHSAELTEWITSTYGFHNIHVCKAATKIWAKFHSNTFRSIFVKWKQSCQF